MAYLVSNDMLYRVREICIWAPEKTDSTAEICAWLKSDIMNRGFHSGFYAATVRRPAAMVSVLSSARSMVATFTYPTFVETHMKYNGMLYHVVLYVASRRQTSCPYSCSIRCCQTDWCTTTTPLDTSSVLQHTANTNQSVRQIMLGISFTGV